MKIWRTQADATNHAQQVADETGEPVRVFTRISIPDQFCVLVTTEQPKRDFASGEWIDHLPGGADQWRPVALVSPHKDGS